MTDKKLSELPAATAIADADLLYVVQSGASKEATASLMKAYIGSNQKPQMVATKCGLNNDAQFNTAQPGICTRSKHDLPYGAKSLYPIYAAFRVTSGAASDTETAYDGGFGWYATLATVAAGGTGYAVGDRATVTVATNQFAPTMQVDAVSAGVVTAASVVDGGGFGAIPATGLATVHTSGSGDDALTVTLILSPCAMVMQAALEQTWATQTAFSNSNLTGVMKFTAGMNAALGKGNIVLPYTESVAFDPLLVGLAAAATIGIRTYTPSAGIWGGRWLKGSGSLNEYTASSTNLASALPYGGTFPTGPSPQQAFQPIAIMGIPQTPGPTFAIVGDSIAYGTASIGHAYDTNGYSGYVEEAINGTRPYSNFSIPADRLNLWLNQVNSAARQKLLQSLNASHVVDQLCVNDFRSAVTYATFAAQKIKFWAMLRGLGIKEIWVTTCTMNTSSTDGWATTVNQTPLSANTAIQLYNAALRNGTFSAYIDRVLDLGTAAESSIASGLWPAGSTTDGLHPTTAQHLLMAAQIAFAFPLATL